MTAAPVTGSAAGQTLTMEQAVMRARVQRALTWTGPVMFLLWVVSWILIARWIPPPSPGKSAEQVVEKYQDHTELIQLGMIITLFASALLVPFCGVIAAHMRRIEGYGGGALSNIQLTSAAVLSLEFIVPLMVWLTATYRVDDTSAETIRMLNDMGWLMFVVVISSAEVQLVCIAVAIFLDRRPDPIFPRWAGYLNLWVVVGLLPAAFVVFFKDGPIAWNGVAGFFVPLTSYGIWMFSMFVLLRRAIDAELADFTSTIED
jgi:hypothetical protein